MLGYNNLTCLKITNLVLDIGYLLHNRHDGESYTKWAGEIYKMLAEIKICVDNIPVHNIMSIN